MVVLDARVHGTRHQPVGLVVHQEPEQPVQHLAVPRAAEPRREPAEILAQRLRHLGVDERPVARQRVPQSSYRHTQVVHGVRGVVAHPRVEPPQHPHLLPQSELDHVGCRTFRRGSGSTAGSAGTNRSPSARTSFDGLSDPTRPTVAISSDACASRGALPEPELHLGLAPGDGRQTGDVVRGGLARDPVVGHLCDHHPVLVVQAVDAPVGPDRDDVGEVVVPHQAGDHAS